MIYHFDLSSHMGSPFFLRDLRYVSRAQNLYMKGNKKYYY